jgi:general secretion pathway protein B
MAPEADMSFILDALKKSESDRQRQASPALFEVKVAAPRRKFPVWAVALGVLLGVNLLGLLWVLLLREPASVAPPPVANAASAPGAGPAPAGAAAVPATTAPPPGNPQAGVVAPSNAPPLAEEPLLSGQEPSVPPDYNTSDYTPAVTRAEANAAAERRAGSVPSREEVLAQGLALPELRLDLHVYAVSPADRFVFINMRKLREGEALPEGVRVDEITKTGAVLSYRSTQFSID